MSSSSGSSENEDELFYEAGLNASQEMPGSYHSPISGFLQLPDDETTDQSSHSSSTDSLPVSTTNGDHDIKHVSKTSEKAVSYRQVANKQSTQTLRAEKNNIDMHKDEDVLDWDNDSPIEEPRAAHFQARTSNTWSASSKTTKAMASALKSSDEDGPSSPVNLSCSLPTPSHMPHGIIRESWDEDFLFQDNEGKEADRSSGESARKEGSSPRSTEKGKWDEDEEVDDDKWGASSSLGDDASIPRPAVSTSTTDRFERHSNTFTHLEGNSPAQRSILTIAGPSSYISPSRLASQAKASMNDDTSPLFFRDKIADRSDQSVFLPSSSNNIAAEEDILEVKRSPITSRRATSVSTILDPPRSAIRNVSENLQQTSTYDSPARLPFRQAEGHWSHFLSSKLSQAKSPEKASKLKPITLANKKTLLDNVNFKTQSPPVSPSAKRSRELSMSKGQSNDEIALGSSRGSHRRGANSLSMSFGLVAPWGWSNRSSHKHAAPFGSLAGASTSSVSLASITADTGRPADESIKLIAAKCEMRDVYQHMSSSALSEKGSSGHVVSAVGMKDRDTIRSSEDRASNSRSHIAARSPSSFRAPLMMPSNRSHSGSTSTATTAMSSSDCATSTGSMTEESTLYGSVDDAMKLSSRLDASSSQILPAFKRSTTADSNSSASRTGASITRPVARMDRALSPPSTAEVQFRLPSDPTPSTIRRNRESTKQTAEDSSPADPFVRRSSLSDLKIPSRITKAQEGFRANMNMVKDFANGIEELKVLREQYLYQLGKCSSKDPRRLEVEEEYSSWWECADVLIGLGQGKGGDNNEANVDSVDQMQPSMTLSSAPPAMVHAQRTSTVSFSPVLVSATGLASGARPPSSRGSSSRSIDPQREIDILSAMLAGTPVNEMSPIRSGMTIRERTANANDETSTNRSGSGIMRQQSGQGHLPLASTSTTSLSFADVDPSQHRSRSHRASASLSTATYLKQRQDTASPATSPLPYAQSSSTAFPGIASTDSFDTQRATRRRRMKSTGRAGLQGLKELLRMFKMNSTALVYQGESSQSRISLNRTSTNEARITDNEVAFNADTDGEVKSKPLSRTRSLFGRTMSRSNSHSPTLQRRPLSIDIEGARLSSRSSSMASSIDPCAVYLSGSNRISSGAGCSTKDTSLDSEWTQGDFDQLVLDDTASNSRPEVSCDGPDELSAKSTSGKRRFFLFSKGFPPSAARRHSRDILHWASSSKESIDLPASRHSLQLPARENHQTPPHSPLGGMPRVTSNTKHPLLNTRGTPIQRSFSSTSCSSAASPTSRVTSSDLSSSFRPSKGSTAATVSTIESSNSSNGTQIATPNTEANRAPNEMFQDNSTYNLPFSRPLQEAPDTHRKLELKPEAIPSLLVYLETTKARCQESLSLLNQTALPFQG